MKNIVKICILILICIMVPNKVLASGKITISTNKISIEEGKNTSFSIKATNAVGKIDISSTDNKIITLNKSNVWIENETINVNVSGISKGNATIIIKLTDVASFDNEVISGEYKINVSVNEKRILSNNTELNELSIEGYELIKKEDIYELEVKYDIDNINIIASPKDSKSKIEGNGKKNIEVGENVFEIIVTSESGNKKSYTIKIFRKDNKKYIEDLAEELKKDENEKIEIILKDDDELITKEILEEIKKEEKIVEFTKKDEDNKTIYKWIIQGKDNENLKEFKTKLKFESNNEEKINNLTNYAEGIHLNFEHSGTLPKNTKINVYVGNKYKDGKIVNIYHYDDKQNKMVEKQNKIKVSNGYVEFDIEHCSEYFVTEATIKKESIENKSNIFLITSIFELIIIIILIILYKKKSNS